MAKSKSSKKEEVKVVDEVIETVVTEEETVEEVVEEIVEEEVEEIEEVEEEVVEEVKVGARSAVDILSLNHRAVVYTIDGKEKTKSIQRAEHKAIAAGDYSSLK